MKWVVLLARHETSRVKMESIARALRDDGTFTPEIWYIKPRERSLIGLWLDYRAYLTRLRMFNPVAVFIPGDRELSPVPPFIKAARKLGIPVINAALGSPYLEGIVLPRIGDKRFTPNSLVARLFPAQIRDGIMFSPTSVILKHAILGMLSPNPWIQGGGFSDYVLHSDPVRCAAAVAIGLGQEKILMTGDPSLDELHRELSVNPKKDIAVLFSMPNDAEHGLCHMAEHLDRMQSYLAVMPKHTVISLHPKSRRENYEPLGFDISNDPLTKLLPRAKLYVCSTTSTVAWAKLCAVPVINLDYWNIADDDFRDCVNVKAPQELKIALQSTIEPVSVAPPTFDGKSGQRIVDFLKGLGTKPSPLPEPERSHRKK